jgi:hypothetical protein
MLKTLINNNKYTSLNITFLIYKTLLKLMLTYVLNVVGNAKKSNINKIQAFQNIALRKLINTPLHISNYTLHKDLKHNSINEEANSYYNRFHKLIIYITRYSQKPSHSESGLGYDFWKPPKRLKRKWYRDLLN